ncbi:hypothetical protein AAHA92_00158 [Salvia divinorum]|uniref:Uncharacterized protein n=1 Tax=Salvia divinorum TaxID=28513 RepID=A0ABD1IL67_SALDI
MEESYLSLDNDDPNLTCNDLNEGRVALKMKSDRTHRSWSPRDEEVLLSGQWFLWWLPVSYFGGDEATCKINTHLIKLHFLLLWCQEDSNARFMRFKLWSMWDAWKDIFGKDRAVGTTAKDLLEMSKEVRSNSTPNLESGESEYVASTDAPSGANPQNNKGSPQGLDQSASDSGHKTQSAKKKKHKGVDRSDIHLEMLAKINEDINSRLDELMNRIGYEIDVSKSRKKVFEILADIQGLTLGQQLDAAGIILEKVQRLDLFMSLPEAFRHTYVVRCWRITLDQGFR